MKKLLLFISLMCACVSVSMAKSYTKVTAASALSDGDKVILACDSKSAYAGAMDGNAYFTKVDDRADAIEITLGKDGDNWTLTTSEGKVGTKAAKKLCLNDGTTTWSISFAEEDAVIESTDSSCGTIQYNASSPRFLNYTSSQTAIQIYKVTEDGEDPGDEPGDEPGTDPVDPKPLPAGVIFYESFDQNEGTGGNDGEWNGSIASNNLILDNEGWTVEKGNGAYQCAKFGAGSAKGIATTPAIYFAGDCTLVFFAGAWDKNGEKTNLMLSAEGATLDVESVVLKKGEFDIYEVNITNATPGFTITFSGEAANNSRFFLDEVEISAASYDLTITEISWATLCLGFSYAAPEGVKFYAATEATTTGITLQEVTTGVKGSLAVFAYGAPGTYRVKATDTYDSNFENILEGVLVDTPCEADANYVLGITAEGTAAVGLHHGTTLKANRGYIPADKIPAGARANLTIDVETAIEQIATEQLFGKVYDLQGRELQSLQKGFNIMNGKKVIVK